MKTRSAAEIAKDARYKLPSLNRLGYNEMTCLLDDIEETLYELRYFVEDGVTYAHNAVLAVKLMLTNAPENASSPLYGAHHPPYTIQGLQPGSSSADDWQAMSSANWTSATFKVTGALALTGEQNNYTS